MLTRTCGRCLKEIPLDDVLYQYSQSCPYCKKNVVFRESICSKCTAIYKAEHLVQEHSSVELVD